MTSRLMYEAILIEMRKENAPDILLEDFNYLSNKAVNQYINKRYNIYDINQQTTDDLSVLKATALLTPMKTSAYGDLGDIGRMMGATFEVLLPLDYLHILNCICVYKVNKTFKCYNKGDIWRRAATRLTADIYSQVLDNFWLRPTYKRPYYYIHNVNAEVDGIYLPTDPRRYIGSSDEYASFQYYIGTTSPTVENYLDLLDRSLLSGLTTIGTIRLEYYILYPSTEELSVWSADLTYHVITSSPVTFGNYKMIKTPIMSGDSLNGLIYIKSNADMTGKGIVGTDFRVGGLSDNYNNREISENGVATSLGTDAFGNQIHRVTENNGVPTSITVNTGGGYSGTSYIERAAQVRYGNVQPKRLEIRYGTDASLFELSRVYIDYIKAPLHIRLTQELLDLTEDTSQVLEFPDYVCQEIVNELVHIIQENIGDQRLLTHPVVSQSIANPAQQLTEPVAQLLPT